MLYELQRPAEAIPAYQRAISLDPGSVGAWFNLGLSLKLTNRVSDAISAFARVLELEPGRAKASQLLVSVKQTAAVAARESGGARLSFWKRMLG